MKAGGFLGGRPEDIIEALNAVEKRYPGLDRVICATPLGTPLDVQLRKGGDPGLPRHQNRRRGAVDPRHQPPDPPFGGTSASLAGRIHQQRHPPNIGSRMMTASRRKRSDCQRSMDPLSSRFECKNY